MVDEFFGKVTKVSDKPDACSEKLLTNDGQVPQVPLATTDKPCRPSHRCVPIPFPSLANQRDLV